MTAQFARAAHLSGRTSMQGPNAPHAALLIDFDNVTMGIRSDLTKELKNLLNSDIIKGKVAVQRAYADWRRYPQYIVPLAESSVDLIFAPAYGTSKKNATDIRLAIDALELVFTRPEIGTFILLSGDSDFSSLVLKLKEYGKYVIGVGIRESASDLLVQNCDEYYSYSALTGLTRAGEEEITPLDPWECAEIAVQRMVEGNDVMRSDRLKQVMLELDPNFDEKALGFTKFNRFLHEAQMRGLISLKKLENGQYEVGPSTGEKPPAIPAVESGEAPVAAAQTEAEQPREREGRESRRSRRGGRDRGRDRDRDRERTEAAPIAAEPREAKVAEAKPTEAKPAEAKPVESKPVETPPAIAASASPPAETGLKGAYDLLRRATRDVTQGKGAARDSDVKRRILEIDPAWSETAIGFTKFSRFLRQAHDAEVINLRKLENGNYELTLPGQEVAAMPSENGEKGGRRERGGRGRERGRGGRDRGERAERSERTERPRHEEQLSIEASNGDVAAEATAPAPAPKREAEPKTPPVAATPAAAAAPSALFRRVSRRGPVPSGPPPLLEGQTIAASATSKPAPAAAAPAEPADEPETADHHGEMIKRLTALKGVGQKTAEAAVAAFGPGVLDVVRNDPKRVLDELGARRAQPLIDAVAEKKKPARPARASSAPRKAGGTKKATASKRARPKKSATKK